MYWYISVSGSLYGEGLRVVYFVHLLPNGQILFDHLLVFGQVTATNTTVELWEIEANNSWILIGIFIWFCTVSRVLIMLIGVPVWNFTVCRILIIYIEFFVWVIVVYCMPTDWNCNYVCLGFYCVILYYVYVLKWIWDDRYVFVGCWKVYWVIFVITVGLRCTYFFE